MLFVFVFSTIFFFLLIYIYTVTIIELEIHNERKMNLTPMDLTIKMAMHLEAKDKLFHSSPMSCRSASP